MTRTEWLEKNGFSQDGITYCIYGDDTYAIKDYLKEQGCKFSPLLKWHASTKIEVPEGYGFIEFKFEELAEWSDAEGTVFYYENSKNIVDRRFKEAEGPSLSEYVGEVGERIRNLTAVFKSQKGFMSNYGYIYIYIFRHNYNILTWFTQKELDLEKNDIVNLTGTVKELKEYNGEKQTILTRCIIKKIS